MNVACRGCGSTDFDLEPGVGPHYAGRRCRACGTHGGWLPKPDVIDTPSPTMDTDQFAIGRTPREQLVWNDLKQIVREQLLAEVRDELYAWTHDLEEVEGVIPTVDDLLDRIRRDEEAA